jgi:tetratricopeptide (TPR) repeat protein
MATFADDTTLRSMNKADLEKLAVRVGLKKKGVGFPTCCPPTGNRLDIINALSRSGLLSDVPTEEGLRNKGIKELADEAVSRGLKENGVTWKDTCGGYTKDNIIALLLGHLHEDSLELSETDATMFENVIRLCSSRDEAEKRTKDTMPRKLLMAVALASFTTVSDPLTQPAPATTFNDLYTQAQQVKPIFDRKIRNWLTQKEIDPDLDSVFDGRAIYLDHGVSAKNHSVAPLKKPDRCQAKAASDYNCDFKRLCDIVRCSIVVDSEATIAELLTDLKRGVDGIKIVKLKNRFAKPLFTGIRDCLLNVEIAFEGAAGQIYKHIGEIQLHITSIIDLKMEAHITYEYFRDFFSGSAAACEKRVVLFDRLKVEKGLTGLELIEEILESADIDRLDALNDLTAPDVLKATGIYTRVNSKLLKLRSEENATNLAVTEMEMKAGLSCLAAKEYPEAFRHYDAANKSVQGLKSAARRRSQNAEEIDEVKLIIRVNIGRGGASLGMKNWDDATKFIKLALDALAGRRDLVQEHLQAKRWKARLLMGRPNPRYAEALTLFREVEAGYDPNGVDCFVTKYNTGLCHRKMGNLEEAKSTLKSALDGLERTAGKGHDDTKDCYEELKMIYEGIGKMEVDLNNLIARYRSLKI